MKNKIQFSIIFVLISLILLGSSFLNPKIRIWIFHKNPFKRNRIYIPSEWSLCSYDTDDKILEYNKKAVPPAAYSHPQSFPLGIRLKYPNTWQNLPPDNNIPGILPGGVPGETLGLEFNPDLNLESPIRAPLVNDIFSFSKASLTQDLYSKPIKNKCLKEIIEKAKRKSKFSSIPASGYYKYRYNQCNPYNGSYCQCTNNYIPLPPIGKCQENGWMEDVCPYEYRLKPSSYYQNNLNLWNKIF